MQHYVITPPETLPVSLEQAKAQCRIDIDLEDDLIERLIRSASQYAEHYQQRTLLETEYGMKLGGFPPVIPLSMPPLRSIVSVVYVDPSGDEITLDGSEYEFDATTNPGVLYPAYGKCWPATRCQRNAVTIRWTAGYDSVPSATQSAILLVVGHLFEHREAISEGTFNEVPMAAKSLLDLNGWGNYR